MPPPPTACINATVGGPGSDRWGAASLASRIICCYALVAQWIEHLTTDQKVVGSTPAERTNVQMGLTQDVVFAKLFVGR